MSQKWNSHHRFSKVPNLYFSGYHHRDQVLWKSTLYHAGKAADFTSPMTRGTQQRTLLHLYLLQEREELLYFSYFNICVKALASQLTVTPKHLVHHLHRNHQTKLGITGRPLSPRSSNFQGISAKCLSITYLDTSTPLQHIQKASKLRVCLWSQNISRHTFPALYGLNFSFLTQQSSLQNEDQLAED